jgi:hypothetical protein
VKNNPTNILHRAWPNPGNAPPNSSMFDTPIASTFSPSDFRSSTQVGDLDTHVISESLDGPHERDEDGAVDRAANDETLGPTIEEAGVDVLARYWPYCVGGRPYWGIWWNEPAMLRAVARVSLSVARVRGSISIDTIDRCVRALVREHELFHYIVEYAAAHVGSQLGSDFYLPSLSLPTRSNLEEPLASAWEMAAIGNLRPRKGETLPDIRAIGQIWREGSLPFPYNHWKDAQRDWSTLVENHASTLGMPAPAGHLYLDLLRTLPANRLASHVPEHHVGLDRVRRSQHAPLLEFLRRPPVKQVIRHARRAETKGEPPGVRVDVRSKHPVAVSREGKSRPITLDPSKWDRTPDAVLSQLADLFDLPKVEYLAQVQAC